MPTTPTKTNITRKLIPQGTHISRVVGFIHVGTVDEEYMGEKKKMNKIRLTWELPEELQVFKEEEGPQPTLLSQEYTLSMGSKSNLRPIVEGIIGTSLTDDEAYSFDVEKLVGMPCLLSIKHGTSKKGVTFSRIAGTAPLMKGQVCKAAVAEYRVLNYQEKWDQAYFDKLPAFIKDKMVSSVEYQSKMNPGKSTIKAVDDMDYPEDEINPDEIPFK